MTYNSSANPYVNLISTKPEYIVSIDEGDRALHLVKAEIEKRTANYSKIYIEIGSGSGTHLVERARMDPDSIYIGFELRFKRLFKTAEKAASLGLTNIFTIQIDATHIPALFNPGSVDGFYVFFPDPWEKRKWRKHRILNPSFITKLHTCLKDCGTILYKTDHQQYFNEVLNMIASDSLFSPSAVSFNLYKNGLSPQNIPSEFEKLFHYKGLPVYMVDLQKNRKIAQDAV